MLALRYGVDPYAVDHVWPVGLRARAVALMAVDSERAARERRKAERKTWQDVE